MSLACGFTPLARSPWPEPVSPAEGQCLQRVAVLPLVQVSEDCWTAERQAEPGQERLCPARKCPLGGTLPVLALAALAWRLRPCKTKATCGARFPFSLMLPPWARSSGGGQELTISATRLAMEATLGSSAETRGNGAERPFAEEPGWAQGYAQLPEVKRRA